MQKNFAQIRVHKRRSIDYNKVLTKIQQATAFSTDIFHDVVPKADLNCVSN